MRTGLLFCCSIFLLLTVSANAETGLRVDPLIGYNGIFQSDGLVPVRMFIRNEGNDIEGALHLTTISVKPGRGEEQTLYRQHIVLPRNSYKSFSFFLSADQMDTLRYSIVNTANVVLLQDETAPKAIKGIDNIVLVLSRSISFDFLSHPGQGKKNRIIYMHPDIMPDSWLAYSQVSALVLHNIQVSDLSDKQLKAIGEWVHYGGTFIIVGGTHFNRSNFNELEDLLPVSLNMYPRDMIKADGSGFGIGSEEIAGLNVSLKDGTILAADGSHPLVVEARRGAGRVIFSAVDFTNEPLKSWSGRNAFWNSILPGQRLLEAATIMEKDFNDKILLNSIEEDLKNSKTGIYFFLIALPLVLSLLVLFFTGKKAAVPFVLFCILLSGVALFVFPTFRQPTAAISRRISILQMADNTIYGRAEHHILLAASRKSAYSLYVPKEDVNCLTGNNQGTITLSSSSLEIQDIRIPKWQYFTCLLNTGELFHYSASLSDY
ncbi:MAG: hypothetical protein JW874_03655, partial [Spirochaetales bacterium]|nr:hypothetical protein [Spirochaetales bacterium]